MTEPRTKADIDRMARALMTEWERVEGPIVGTSFHATFADLARVALAEAADPGVAALRERLDFLIDRALRIDPPLDAHQWRSFVDGLVHSASLDIRAVPSPAPTPDLDEEQTADRAGVVPGVPERVPAGFHPGRGVPTVGGLPDIIEFDCDVCGEHRRLVRDAAEGDLLADPSPAPTPDLDQ